MTEFTGVDADTISFEMVLSIYLGTDPMADLTKIWEYERGGKALSVNRTLLLAFGPGIPAASIKKQVVEISSNICRCMDKTGELFAEFGLDIAVDKYGHLWFIEANVRPSFKGFKLMDYKNYLYICSRPIIYAVQLAGFESDGDAT